MSADTGDRERASAALDAWLAKATPEERLTAAIAYSEDMQTLLDHADEGNRRLRAAVAQLRAIVADIAATKECAVCDSRAFRGRPRHHDEACLWRRARDALAATADVGGEE